MPAAMGGTFWQFLDFKEWIEGFGFVQTNCTQLKAYTGRRLPSLNEYLNRGSEIGFMYEKNDLIIVCWTSVEEGRVSQCFRDLEQYPLLEKEIYRQIVTRLPNTDLGWALVINKAGEAQYFSHPFNRTKGFFRALFRKALIIQARIDGRPDCPQCQTPMNIRRKDDGGVHWRCVQRHLHAGGEYVDLGWDHNLPEKAKAMLAPERKQRAAQRKKTEEETGRKPQRARFIRAASNIKKQMAA